MNMLVSALRVNDANQGRTVNGAVTNKTSLCANLDLFFVGGSARNTDITPLFAKAYAENEELALRVAQWIRDCRGGAGERQTFRAILNWLIARAQFDEARALLYKLPLIGRWDDVLVALGTPVEDFALRMVGLALHNQDGLCAKWMPRKGPLAVKLREGLGLSPKAYRKTLVNLSKTVEQQMCAGDWGHVAYKAVPGVAFARYKNAFARRDPQRFTQFLDSVQKGETKINASNVFPHDIVRSLRAAYGNNDTVRAANEQWKALPDYMADSEENVLPLVDVSGSMSVQVSGSISALDVALGLGLYCSERLNGAFKDAFLTFSSETELQQVSGSLSDRMKQMNSSKWGMSTDLNRAFEKILQQATLYNVPEADMPTKILILSDMEFNSCGRLTNYENIVRKYAVAGYKCPQIVFWNINGRAGNVPVKLNQPGVALVSGFSPAILQSVLNGSLNPMNVMLETVLKDRYDLALEFDNPLR